MKKIILTFLIVFPFIVSAAWYDIFNPFSWNATTIPEQSFGLSILTVPQGGTGRATFTTGECLVGNGTGGINTQACSAGGGEVNTGGSLGTGLNIFDSKSGVQLRFNSLSAGSNITLSTTTNSNTIVIASTASGSGGSAFEIATTSDIAVPNLAYFTKTGGMTTLGSVATTTLTASSPLSLDNPVVKVGGSNSILTCTTAASGVAGCLSNTSFDTFNNKESVLTFGLPMLRTANTINWVGLATTSQPSSSNLLVSNGGAGVFGVATGTISSSGGITTTAGRSAVGGALAISCDVASGSVAGCLSTANWTTFNSKLGSYDAWTHPSAGISATTSLMQLFGQASSTLFSSNYLKVGATASTTIDTAGNISLPATGTLTVPALTSALTLTGAGGEFAEYAGTTCTNQFARSLSALGVATCATVGAADVSLANLTATNSSLTFSGTYDGSAARTIGLNVGNANTWTALQTFANATSTLFTATNMFFSGGTTDITTLSNEHFVISPNGTGRVGIGATTTPNSILGVFGTTTTHTLNVDNPNATGTSTMFIYSDTAGFGGEIILEDTTGTACTSITSNAGSLITKVITCPSRPTPN